MKINRLIKNRFVCIAALGVALGLLVFFAAPNISQASVFGNAILWALDKVVGFVIGVVGWVLNQISSGLFSIAGAVVDATLDLNSSILTSKFVLSGFNVSLSIANLGFVVAIIVIAFSTILGIAQYGIKSMLWKLIVAAVLVNFSLTIAGLLLDVTGVFTEFFMSQITAAGKTGFSAIIGSAFGINALSKPPDASTLSPGQGLKETVRAGVSLIFIFIFTILAAAVMLGIGVMYFVRYLILSVLLVLMPLAWLFWVLPKLEKHFSEWWETFFKWAFFAPASSFFFYLTILSLNGMKLKTPAQQNLGFFPKIEDLLYMVIALGFMTGALIVADKMGLAGAGAFLNVAKGIQGKAVGIMKGGAKLGAQFGARKLLPKERLEKVQEKISGLAGKAPRGLKGLAGLAARGVSGAAARAERFGGKDAVKEAEGRFKDMTTGQLKAVSLSASNPEKVALMKELVKRGDVDKIDAGKFNTLEMKAASEAVGEGKTFSDFQKASGMSTETNTLLQTNAEVLSSVGKRLQELTAAEAQAAKAHGAIPPENKEARDKAEKEWTTHAGNLDKLKGSAEYGNYNSIIQQMGQAQAEFFAGFTDEDRDKPQWGDIYNNKDTFGLSGGLKTVLQQATSMGVASGRPGMMPRIAPKLKSDEFDNYKITMVGKVTWKKDDIITSGALAGLTGEQQKSAEKAFTRTLDRRNLGLEPGKKKKPEVTAGGATPATEGEEEEEET